MTQQEFADRLRVKRNTVGQWECGINALTDQMIKLICQEFRVNEEWLRTGNGEMFIKLSRDEEMAELIGNLMSQEDDSFKKRLISGLAALDETGWEVLENFLNSIQKKEN